MEKDPNFKEAWNYCIFLLSKRDYSRYKIEKKLKTRKYDEEICKKVIEKLISHKYLNEDRYRKVQIKSMLYRGYAESYIKRKLNAEKLCTDDDEIQEIRNEYHLSIDDNAKRLIEKKLRNKEIPADFESKQKLKTKIIRHLISKGYSYQKAIEQLPGQLK